MERNSVEKISRTDCTGCMMCGDICAKSAITFETDNGFWFPIVNSQQCINCGLCLSRCPGNHSKQQANVAPLRCIGAKSKNEATRFHSTSGGFFSELASYWIRESNVIAGAEYNEDQQIVHRIEQQESGILKLRQSKYAQSDTTGIYKEVKAQLTSGNKVLFCGTPCQVSALLSYLGRPYENLLTMDFVCLGICSPLVYMKYLKSLEQQYKSKVSKVWFKNKRQGWCGVGTLIQFESGKEYFRTGKYDRFMTAFIKDALCMRSSCHSCKFRSIHHKSDITVADFWGIEDANPDFNDDMGVSAVLLNSAQGIEYFEKIKGSLDWFETTADQIMKKNFSVYKPLSPHHDREAFLTYISNHSFDDACEKYSSYSGLNRWKSEYRWWKTNLRKRYEKVFSRNN